MEVRRGVALRLSYAKDLSPAAQAGGNSCRAGEVFARG